MQATLNICRNPFHLASDREQHRITEPLRLVEVVHHYGITLSRPVICIHNGEYKLRDSWAEIVVTDRDVVAFVYPLQGGGGSNPLRLVLTIALAVYAPYLAQAIAPSLGIAQGTIGFSLLKAGIGLAGTALINAMVPPPQLPKSRQQAQLAAPSPTYSISAQGNQARIGQAIPVLYGTLRVYPDFAAQPYVEYEDNDQFLYQLFCISQGKVQFGLDDVRIEDTHISGFGTDYQIEKIDPYQASGLFPYEVYNVSEVSGQELIDIQIGYFAANPATTEINKIAYDLVLPRGLSYINNDGGYEARTLNFKFYCQLIDDLGIAIGPVIELGEKVITEATTTPIRRTYKYDVAPGRYQVAAKRVQAKSNDQRFANDAVWSGARTYSTATRTYGNVTLMALKLKATNTISGQSSRKVNILATRMLSAPSIDEEGFISWGLELPTQSIAWAVADMCRASYGAGVHESRFNIGQLIQLHNIWEDREDTLNCIYDSAATFWEALTLACRAGRVRPYIQGGMINFVRDSLQTLPTVLFSNRNIVKDSLEINYVMPSEDNADAVDVEYFDKTLWKPRVVRAKLDPGSPTKPVKVQAFGITDRAQAFREGMYMAAANRYRRKEISFETELEGHIPSLGDLIGIQNDMPSWGQYGEAIATTANSVESSEPFEWVEGANHFMMLRTATGGAIGPIAVTKGAEDNILVFNPAEVTIPIYTGFEKEKTHIVFGPAGRVIQFARVLSIKPRNKTVEISAINEDARVHSADGTPVPIDIFEWALPTPSLRPVLQDFTLTQSGSGLNPQITMSWQPPAGSTRFIIETSADNSNWAGLAEITQNSFSFVASLGLLYVRVAAFGSLKGPYVTKSINVGEVAPPPDVTVGTITPTGQMFGVKWTPVIDCDAYRVQIVVAASVKREFTITENLFDYSVENAYADGGPWRSIGVRVWALKGNVPSQNPLILSGTNQAPAAPTITLVPGQGSIGITVTTSADLDYAGTLIYASETSEFTPGPANLIYEGTGNYYLLITDSAKFIKAAHYDTYGKTGLNYSNEYSTSPSASVGGIEVVGAPLPSTGNFEGRVVYLTTSYTDVPSGITYEGDKLYTFDADTDTWNTGGGGLPGPGQVTNEMLAGDITANKLLVANLAAINANMGAITSGSITLDTAGYMRGGMAAFGVGTGVYVGYSYANAGYVMQVGNSSKGFAWDNVNFTIKGDFVAGSININNLFLVSSAGVVTIKSAATGFPRREQTNQVDKMWDAAGTLRLKLGNLDA